MTLPTPPANPVSEVARIARHLHSGQVHALLAAAECKGGAFWTPYPVGDSILAKSGELTPLGIAVREYLLSPARKEESDGI